MSSIDLNGRLKELRTMRGFSIELVAKALTIPMSTYRDYEKGARIPADIIPAVIKFYGIDFSSFYSIDNARELDNLDVSINKLLKALNECLHSIEKVNTRTREIGRDNLSSDS